MTCTEYSGSVWTLWMSKFNPIKADVHKPFHTQSFDCEYREWFLSLFEKASPIGRIHSMSVSAIFWFGLNNPWISLGLPSFPRKKHPCWPFSKWNSLEIFGSFKPNQNITETLILWIRPIGEAFSNSDRNHSPNLQSKLWGWNGLYKYALMGVNFDIHRVHTNPNHSVHVKYYP